MSSLPSAPHASPSLEPQLGEPTVPLSLSMFLIGAGEVIASPMMLEMAESFGVNSARVAWLPGSYALTYASLAPFLGPISDRFGRKALLVPGLVGLGLTVGATAFSPSLLLACFTSALSGACAAAIQPSALSIVNDSVSEARQPAVTGKVFLGMTSSFVLVPALGAQLATHVSWRLPYFLMSAMCFLTAVLVSRMPIRRAPRRASAAVWSAFRAAFAIPHMRTRFAISFLWLGICIGLATLLGETSRRRFGLSTEQVGTLTGSFGLAVLGGNLLMDRVRRFFGSHLRVLVYGSLATIIGAAIVDVLPPSPLYVLAPAGLVWGLGYGMAGPAHHFLVATSSGEVRGTVVGINASILNSGLMAVTLLAGRVLDRTGVEWFVAAMLSLQALGLCLIFKLPRGAPTTGGD